MGGHVTTDATPTRAAAMVVRFDCLDDPAALEADWRALEARGVGDVFAGYDFVATWVEAVARAQEIRPRIVVARDGEGGILAILPFGIRRAFGVRLLEFLGGDQADYPGGLFAPALIAGLTDNEAGRREFRRRAIAAAGPADVLHLVCQRPQIEGRPNPFFDAAAPRSPIDAHELRIQGSFDDWYAAKRQKGSRKNDRAKLRKLEETGPVRFVTATSPEEVRAILAALMPQKTATLAAQGVADMFAPPGVRTFYETLAQRTVPDGPTHVAALYCGDEPVACTWSLVRGERYYYLLCSYAAGEVTRTSPGLQLLLMLMRWAVDNNHPVFDFTAGDEGYKADWCDTAVPLHVGVQALTAAGLPVALALRAANALKRRIKTTPPLWALAQTVRRKLHRGG